MRSPVLYVYLFHSQSPRIRALSYPYIMLDPRLRATVHAYINITITTTTHTASLDLTSQHYLTCVLYRTAPRRIVELRCTAPAYYAVPFALLDVRFVITDHTRSFALSARCLFVSVSSYPLVLAHPPSIPPFISPSTSTSAYTRTCTGASNRGPPSGRTPSPAPTVTGWAAYYHYVYSRP